MDLNNIKLPVSVTADLYRSYLVEENDRMPEDKELLIKQEEQAKWKSLGSNNKNILIIVNSNEAVYLPDNELTFLTGVLTACKLSLADVAIINLYHYPAAAYKELTIFFNSKIVLLFDIEPASFGLPMSFPNYQLQAFAGNSFLYAPSLKQLENDRVEKSKLWLCLKRLFNI